MEPFAPAPSTQHLPFGAASNSLGAAAPPFVPRGQTQPQPTPQVPLVGAHQQQPLGPKSAPATPYAHGVHALPVSPLAGYVSIPGSPMRGPPGVVARTTQPSVSDYFHRPPPSKDFGFFPPGARNNLPQSFQQIQPDALSPRGGFNPINHRHPPPPWLTPGSPRLTQSAGSSLAPSPLTSPRCGGNPLSGSLNSPQRALAATLADPLFHRLLQQQQQQQQHSPQHSLYKTELCRSYEETGTCRYGAKCQFSHGRDELRPVLRHPKYKTEVCRTFAQNGTCPYGTRCRFIHQRAPTKSVLGTLIAAAHVVVPSDWRPEGKPGGGAGGGSGSGRRDSAEDTPRRLPIFQHIAADEEEEEDEEAKEADRLIAETRKRIPEPRFVSPAAKPPATSPEPTRFDISGQ